MAGKAGASLAGVVPALTFVNVGISSAKPPLSSMPKLFLSGPAAAAGIAIINSIATPTVAYPANCIPVTPGATYKLSGWIFRGSAQDNAYLDFNDGVACSGTGSFTDQQAVATSTNVWEFHQASVTIPATMTGI